MRRPQGRRATGTNYETLRRTERFGLSLSAQERAGLRMLAEIEGLAEADVLRRMLRQAIDWPPMTMARSNNGDRQS